MFYLTQENGGKWFTVISSHGNRAELKKAVLDFIAFNRREPGIIEQITFVTSDKRIRAGKNINMDWAKAVQHISAARDEDIIRAYEAAADRHDVDAEITPELAAALAEADADLAEMGY